MSDAADKTIVLYHIGLPDGSMKSFAASVGPEAAPAPDDDPPDWAALDFHKCDHCPLSSVEHPWCPAAASIARLVAAFDELWSYDTVSLDVTTPERTFVFDQIQLQDALRSLMGLVLPTSGCPHTAFFRPMARFHVPLSSVEETIYRAASMYLLGQWMRRSQGHAVDFDLDGLTELYERVAVVNRQLHKRLSEAVSTDASQNAVALLGVFSQFLPMAVDESLAPLRPLFDSYVEAVGD